MKRVYQFVEWFSSLEKLVDKLWLRRRNWVLAVALLVVIIAHWQYVVTGGRIDSGFFGDADYFAQAYEAVRKTIVEYGQFPWWNPWIGGGVPLFANPQVGVLSVQTAMVIVFGAVTGLKLSIVAYKLAAFIGMMLLLRRYIGAPVLVSLVLSFIWVTNGFFSGHLIDHYTFVFFALIPLLAWMQLSLKRRWMWLIYGLTLGLMALAAVHYALLHAALLLGVLFAGQILWARRYAVKMVWKLVVSLSLAIVVAAVIAAPRLYVTLQYIGDFSRDVINPAIPVLVLVKSLFLPVYNVAVIRDEPVSGLFYAPWEYGAYVGLLTLAALGLAGWIIYTKFRSGRRRELHLTALFAVGGCAAFVIALGDYGTWSPFEIVRLLPAFSSTQVPSRWLVWVILAIILLLAVASKLAGKTARSALILCMLVAAAEVTVVSALPRTQTFDRQPIILRQSQADFTQTEFFDPYLTPPTNQSPSEQELNQYLMGRSFTYEATRNNIGELRGYEPLFDTRSSGGDRCNEYIIGCNYILTDNARLADWSPNRIRLERTAPGVIRLNVAPSQYWIANDGRVCPSCTVTSSGQLEITDDSTMIVLEARPSFARPAQVLGR